MWSSIGVFVLGIVFLGTQSAHIPTICKSLNNCAVDEKFSSQYQQAKDMAVTAQELSKSAENVEELQTSQQQLKDAIAQLKTIPPSAKVYDTAKKEVADYQSQLTKIQSRLDKESQALDSINQAEQQAKDADEQIRKAQTVSEYEAVKEKWDKALAILNDIPSDTFISERVTNLKESYQSKRKEVDKIIEELKRPTPTPSPSPSPTVTLPSTPSEPTPTLSDTKWDYSVFNSRKTESDREIQYILKSGARYDDSNKQVEWIVDKKINCFRRICFKAEFLKPVFTAVFKDRDAVLIGTQVLFEDGEDYPKRYILTIPDSVWSRWSEVSQVIIEKQYE
jgi:tetratricopeptide (TPR) repeat protein